MKSSLFENIFSGAYLLIITLFSDLMIKFLKMTIKNHILFNNISILYIPFDGLKLLKKTVNIL